MDTFKNKSQYKIFIVEDNKLYAQALKKQLSDEGFWVKIFYNGKDCISHLHQTPDIITLDYTLPDLTGHEVLEAIKEKLPKVNIIVVSAQESIETATNLIKEGANDYIVKAPDTRERLSHIVKKIYQTDELKNENILLKEALREKYNFKKLIKGNRREIDQIFDLMDRATKTNISVSITGETGTGKELVAQGIHYNSQRNNKPFITVNISSIPDELIEKELFGYEKGTSPGAGSQKRGKIEQANNGTLFLDEIADLSLSVQAKLLRVIQEKEVIRLGGNEIIPLNVRIITATHKNLSTLVTEGKFRQDLYYRLYGLPIEIPPLRDRGNDIILLAKHFIDEFCKENEMEPKVLTDETKHLLLSYYFPGNIRELKAIMELSCVLSNSDTIKPQHLNMTVDNSLQNLLANEKTLAEYNHEILKHYMNKYNQNVRLVASKLEIGKSTIYRMLQKKMT